MKALLDAHALLWYLTGSNRLSRRALTFIQQRTNILFVSPATLWEISIKDALGKLTLPKPFEQLFPAKLDAGGILILPALLSHLHQHQHLPPFHHDPFDRLIIAQALGGGFDDYRS